MTAHTCSRCGGLQSGAREVESEIRNLLRTAEKNPGTPRASGCLTRISELKARLSAMRTAIREHRDEAAS